MIKSMTGYGRAVGTGADEQIVVEISSVNRKTLDIAISLPREWQSLEPEIAAAVREQVTRGRINISISAEAGTGGETSFFNSAAIAAALKELEELASTQKIPFEPDAGLLLDLASLTRGRSTMISAEAVSEILLATLAEALDEWTAMRRAEGDALARDLAEREVELKKALQQIRELAAKIVPDYREELLKRLRQSGLEFELEDERVLKEIAIYADRIDISEELTRLESHFDLFNGFLKTSGPVGRKFEFLLQEIGREFNTIGSKASESAISRIVIDCKAELERIREQVQNIE